jgi:DNA-binding NtrC family response regulator
MANREKFTILVLDDDFDVNTSVRTALELKYENVVSFTNAHEALESIGEINPDLVLLDIFLGSHNGIDLLEQFRKEGLRMPVIMITAFSDIKLAVQAMKLGAEDFIVKPLDLEQLELAVEKALENLITRRQVEVLTEQVKEDMPSEIIGDSKEIKSAVEMARRFSKADDTTVIILGESGTGKELMARFIHEKSDRKKGPFVAINCGAIPKELAESEFFGHEKGAFTGALDRREGRFEQANGGTIFLDEVGELSLDMQVRLLRVLQEKKFYRVGGNKEISVNVRVISATNRDLEKMVEENRFREDLFYRLNVASIQLPPLRERGNDIMTLATSFIKKFNKKLGRSITGFTKEAADVLLNYNWKGNIRELMNVIEHAVLLEPNNVIDIDSLKISSTTNKVVVANPTSGVKEVLEILEGKHRLVIANDGAPMSEVVKDLIVQTLKITNGNQIQAAKTLGISRARLRYRIEQLGINITGKIIS